MYESSCSTKYSEIRPGKYVGDTACEKIPVEVCGAGCSYQDGAEECHDKLVTSVHDTPEEICDLNPQQICRFIIKLAPKLEPVKECSSVPKESCQLKYSTPTISKRPILTKWCLDEEDLDTEETERSGQDPVLDTGRGILRSQIEEIEKNSLEQIREKRTKTERKAINPKIMKRAQTKRTDLSDNQLFQTVF